MFFGGRQNGVDGRVCVGKKKRTNDVILVVIYKRLAFFVKDGESVE